jgi:hypothetical protein
LESGSKAPDYRLQPTAFPPPLNRSVGHSCYGRGLEVGYVIVLVLSIAFMLAALVNSDPGTNKYGRSPK